MQLERTQNGWLSTRTRFLVIAVIVLAVAGIRTISLMANSGTAGQPAQPASRAKASPPALAMRSFAGIRPAGTARSTQTGSQGHRLSGRRATRGRQRRRLSGDLEAGPRRVLELGHPPGDLPAQSAPETLTTVTHGPAGWLAVGVPGPVVLASADGTTWRPAAGNIAADLGKTTAVSAAAGPRGYVILGRLAVQGGGCVADVWWSADLTSWKRAHDVNGTDGSSQTLAVAALSDGFVSVGSHNGKPAAWVTSDGTTWRTIFLSGPANAQLNQIAVTGARGLPLAARRPGTALRPSPCPHLTAAPPGSRRISAASARHGLTALAGGERGWIAAGQYGPPGRPRSSCGSWHPVGTLGSGTGRRYHRRETGKTPAITALGVSRMP